MITSSLPRDNGEAWSYEAAFSRNLGLIDEREQDRLRHARVAIAGQGGVGGVHLVTLARMGIGRFTIADPDTFETANTNRQFGALRSAVGGNKAEVMAGLARDVNPELEIHVMPVAVEAHNQDDFLRGADVLVDGLDAFELPARRRLFTRAAELGIPTITAGPIGFSTAWLVFDPDGMTFDEYFDFHGDMDPDEMFAAFVAGLVPEATQRDYLDPDYVDVEARTGPSVAASCQLAAGVVGGEVAKLLLGRGEVRPVPCYSQFDPFVGRLVRGRLANGNRGPLQRVKRKLILNHLRRLREGRLSD